VTAIVEGRRRRKKNPKKFVCVLKQNVTVSTGRKSWALVTSSFVRLAEAAARPTTFDSFQQQPNVRRRTPQECQSEPTQQQQHICFSYV
jgi:hypothetical protein